MWIVLVILHSANKSYMFKSASALGDTLSAAADRIERLAGSRPCHAFRARGDWRSSAMFAGLQEIDYRLVGWGWMLWDMDWFRPRTADRIVARISAESAPATSS